MPTTLILKKTPFLKTLKAVVQNITSQNAIPVLKYVYFDVQADKLVLKSSNATTTLEKAMPVEEDVLTIDGQPTTLLIDAKFFLTVANSLNSDDITLIVDDTKKTITLKTPSTEMDLKGLDAEQYPRIKEINNQEAISLDTKDLIQALNETVVSVSKQESRPILTGVTLDLQIPISSLKPQTVTSCPKNACLNQKTHLQTLIWSCQVLPLSNYNN